MIILKFGGTSVSTKERIETICEIVKKERNKKPIVVVSAIRGVTDLLLLLPAATIHEETKILQQIREIHMRLIATFDKITSQEMAIFLDEKLAEIKKLLLHKKNTSEFSDRVVAYGEIISSFLISKAIDASGISSEQVSATECIMTDNNFGSAEFLAKETELMSKRTLLPLINKNIIPVVTGFIGRTKTGKTTTLGRSGSDYTAAIIGYALSADEIQIWTDVDGIYSADPRVVKDAKLLKNISYYEASELAAFGAKVLHPRTIRPAIQKGIPVRILNTLNPHAKGTLIEKNNHKQLNHIAAIATKKKVVVVNLYTADMLLRKGFLANVFRVFSHYHISVDLVTVSEVSVSVSLDNSENLSKALAELKQFAEVTILQDCGMISLIGEGVGSTKNLMEKIFSILNKLKTATKMISLSTADINISFVVSSAAIDDTVAALHTAMITRKGKI